MRYLQKPGLETRDDGSQYRRHGTILCECGCPVPLLSGYTNSCGHCDCEYNGAGQLLASDWRMAVRYGGGDWDIPYDPEPLPIKEYQCEVLRAHYNQTWDTVYVTIPASERPEDTDDEQAWLAEVAVERVRSAAQKHGLVIALFALYHWQPIEEDDTRPPHSPPNPLTYAYAYVRRLFTETGVLTLDSDEPEVVSDYHRLVNLCLGELLNDRAPVQIVIDEGWINPGREDSATTLWWRLQESAGLTFTPKFGWDPLVWH